MSALIFLDQLRVKHDVVVSPVADFLIGDYTFEVGGKKPCEVETQKYRRKWIFTFVYINGNKKYASGKYFFKIHFKIPISPKLIQAIPLFHQEL